METGVSLNNTRPVKPLNYNNTKLQKLPLYSLRQCRVLSAAQFCRFLYLLLLSFFIFTVMPLRDASALTIPISLNQETTIESIDMGIIFDSDMLEVTGVSLAGGILEGYIADYNVINDILLIVIYASGNLTTGKGNFAFVTFHVKDAASTAVVLSQIICNEQPADGAFNYNGELTKNLVLNFNHAPVLNTSVSPKLDPINQNDISSSGNTVGQLIADGSITDEDGSASKSIAVIGVDNTNGSWQFSTTNGLTWIDFSDERGSIVSLSDKARLLDDVHQIRFIPNSNWSGTATFTFRAWDKTAGVIGETADARSVGGVTAFSQGSGTASINVLLFQANAGSDQSVFETEIVTLDGSGSSGVIRTYRWKQIEGIPVTLSYSMSINPWFIVPSISSGSITLTFSLTIEDKNGVTSSDTVTITASNYPAPSADFQASPVSGAVPLDVAFTDLSQGKIHEWEWNFGDGFKSLNKNPIHTYTAAGTYSVSLTVKGPGGEDAETKSSMIVVQKVPLKSDFTAAPVSGAPPLNVTFTPMFQGEVTEWLWNFGNGKTSSQKNPTAVYSTPGSYNVSLTIKGPEGSHTELKTGYITVIERTLSGKVTASDTGNPLSNCWVEVWNGDTFIKGGYSDTSGAYMINGLPASNNLVVYATPSDMSVYNALYYNQKETRTQADRVSTLNASLPDINFVLPRQPRDGIAGRVHDGQKGLSGMRVTVFSKSLSISKSAVTGTDGDYTITGLKPTGDYRVSVWSDALTTEFFYAIPKDAAAGVYLPTYSAFSEDKATLITPQFPPIQHIDVIVNLNQGAAIEGQVYEADGVTPVKGVWVNAWSEELNSGGKAMTDENGTYKITGLDEVSAADVLTKGYRVEIPPTAYAYQAFDRADRKENAAKVASGSTEINFYLKRMNTISGVITDTSGNPVAGADVIAWSSSAPTLKKGSAASDSSGRYSLHLPVAADYIVQVFPKNFMIQYFNQKTDILQANFVDITYGNADNINFVLSKGGVIKGQVFIGSNSAPAGMIVNIWSERNRTGGDTQTDAQGRYELAGLNPSVVDYVISIRQPGYVPSFYHRAGTVYDLESAERVSPSESENRNIVLITGFSIKGTVTFNGEPVGGIRVESRLESGNSSGSVTGSDGHYAITGLLPGKYEVSIAPINYLSQTKTVDIQTSDAAVNFVLTEEPERSISGVVSGLEPGKIFTVTASSLSKKVADSIQIEASGTSEPYTISGLKPASDYVVEFISPDYLYQIYKDAFRLENAAYVNLSGSDAQHINFTAKIKSARISGNVTFPSDAAPGDRVRVIVFSRSVGFMMGADATVGDSKTVPYSVSGLVPAADYVLYVTSDQYLTFYYNGTSGGANIETEATALDVIQNPSITIHLTLSRGASISGRILDKNGKGIAGIPVEAYSPSTNSTGFAVSSEDGSYTIQGLQKAKDFMVIARHSSFGTLYYSDKESVRDQSLTTLVSTIDGQAENITIQIAEMGSISGNMTDLEGNPLHFMWAQADSAANGTRQGVFTDSDGHYEIKGLFSGKDYTVSARPNWFTEPIEKLNIATGSVGINFRLNPNVGYIAKGIVSDSTGKPIPRVRVEAWSERMNIRGNLWSVSDLSGNYELRGIPESDDYMFLAFPPLDTPYAFYFEKQISIPLPQNTKHIQLTASQTISGRVNFKNGMPIENAQIVAISLSNNFKGQAFSKKDGTYEIRNVPDGSDYDITVITGVSYLGSSISGITPGSGIDFNLDEIGNITGEIRDKTTGNPLPNVIVETVSETMRGISGFFGSAMTDQNGVYTIRGLRNTNQKGNPIDDYTVKAVSGIYPPAIKTGRRVGETVSFTLFTGKENELSGTIFAYNGKQIQGADCIAEIFEINGKYVSFERSDRSGNFKFSILDPDKEYLLKITAYVGTEERLIQWAGEGDSDYSVGVDNPVEPYDPPSNAKRFKTNTSIRFKFSREIPSSAEVKRSNGPGQVRNIESDTHMFTKSSDQIGISSITHTDVVSNNPIITVTWDSSGDADEGYYYEFNRIADFVITKRSAPPMPPIKTRQITSGKLTGNNVSYYFHVAAVNDRGRIGATSTREFRIDTVPPSDGAVLGPETTTAQSVLLTLGAADAKEMYISNIGYAQGGMWESRVKEKTWQMTEGDGLKKIYVQLKDDAGNTANYLVSVEKKPLKGNSVPVMKDQTFSVDENSAIGKLVGRITASSPNSEAKLTFSVTEGDDIFAVDSGTGDITVIGKLDYEKQPMHILKVEVSDGKNKTQAEITIHVKDLLEVAPQTFFVDKNAEPGTIVGEIAADGPISTLSYTLVSGNTGDTFSINAKGEILINPGKTLDFKTTPKYDLLVRVSDGKTTVTAVITIQLTESKLIVNNQSFTVDITSANGTVVGKVKAAGPNPNLTFEIISGNTGNAFKINSATGEITINDNSQFNMEQTPRYIILIRVSDGTETVEAKITISIQKQAAVIDIDWIRMQAGSPKNSIEWFKGVSGNSRSEMLVVGGGYDYSSQSYYQVILNYRDHQWHRMIGVGKEFLYQVRFVSDNSAYAVGWNGVILYFDGVQWTSMNSPTTEHLTSLSVIASDNNTTLYAAGHTGTILRFDGAAWIPISKMSSKDIYDIWGSSESTIFAVGDGGLILHFNGKEWQILDSQTDETLRGVWGTSENNVFAVGDNGLILHYNGTEWETMDSTTDESLYDIFGSKDAGVIAVGDSGTTLLYDGTAWNKISSLTQKNLKSIWYDSETIVCVGDSGTILKSEK